MAQYTILSFSRHDVAIQSRKLFQPKIDITIRRLTSQTTGFVDVHQILCHN